MGSSLTSRRFPDLWAAPSLPGGTRLLSPALPLHLLSCPVQPPPVPAAVLSVETCPPYPLRNVFLYRKVNRTREVSREGGPQLGHLKPRPQPRASAPPNLAHLSIQVSTRSIPIMGRCLKAVLETPSPTRIIFTPGAARAREAATWEESWLSSLPGKEHFPAFGSER